MQVSAHIVIILLSSIVILSYFFSIISRFTKIPSVLLLLGTGIGIKYLSGFYGYVEQDVAKLVRILGTVGLIMIILEAALDLTISRSKVTLIRQSLLLSGFTFLLSCLSIGWLLTWWLQQPLRVTLIYAIPMSIISSAILIPSTSHLGEHKKEFLVYESSFSDIIGILAFNYMLMDNVLSARSFLAFGGNLFLAIIISVVASLLLLYFLTKTTVKIKFFLMFAILALVYCLGDIIKIPSLLIILVFGLVLNNSSFFLRGKFKKLASAEYMNDILGLMKSITAETSFLIRTFFFILFGYTISLEVFILPEVILPGTLIIFLLLALRFVYFVHSGHVDPLFRSC